MPSRSRVGAIAILIVETGVQRGFRAAAAAGAGTATADFLYATLAMAAGSAIGPILAPWSVALRVGAIAVILGIRLLGIVRIGGRLSGRSGTAAGDRRRPTEAGRQLLATYARFLGLTLLNPATVIYFAALVLALPVLDGDPFARPAFVIGAFAASLSWQTLIAAIEPWRTIDCRRAPSSESTSSATWGSAALPLPSGGRSWPGRSVSRRPVPRRRPRDPRTPRRRRPPRPRYRLRAGSRTGR
jgi:threonine/homoserine/homoserine lactone efflux protein